MDYSYEEVLAAIPFVSLILVSSGMLVLDLFGKCSNRLIWLTIACVFSAGLAWPQYYFSDTAFNGMVFVDCFSFVFYLIILTGTLLTFFYNNKYLSLQRAESSVDVDMLIILAACGGMVMVSAAHLIVLFVGFELLSVSVYVLTGVARNERASSEGALKYFILGAFSSAFLLYGMTLVYGATGTMMISEIAAQGSVVNPMFATGIGLIIFGFAFKVGLVPFHVWTPDAYQGAPVSITGFMAVVVKTAAFASFLRIMYVSFGDVSDVWAGFIWILAVLTMSIGNIVALRQESIKRMLAYSSIAHAGYIVMGFLALDTGGGEATIFYLFVYTFMTLAAFGVVLIASAGSTAQYEEDSISTLSGLGWSHPFLGICMSIAMLSLAGMPPFAGFIGKLYIFKAAVDAGYFGLVIIAALNSVVSLAYYLRVLVVMYFGAQEASSWTPRSGVSRAPKFALGITALATLLLGVLSQYCVPAIEQAIKSLG